MDGKRRSVTSSAVRSTSLSTGSVSVADRRKTLLHFLRRAAGYIFAALSSRSHFCFCSAAMTFVRNLFISSKSDIFSLSI